MLWEVIYFRFLFCAVFSSLSIPPPELTAGGENLAPPAEEVGCILSLALRCSAPSVRSVGWAESRLARVVLVNVRRLFCRSCGVCLLSCFVFVASACLQVSLLGVRRLSNSREFKIPPLRTTTMEKHATAHDQNHVTVHFSRVVQRLRWVVELFRVVGTTENILVVFCRLGNSKISSFRKTVFNSPALSGREAKYVSCV